MKRQSCTTPLMKPFTHSAPSRPFILILFLFHHSFKRGPLVSMVTSHCRNIKKKSCDYYWFLFQCELMAQLLLHHLQSRAFIFQECLFMTRVQTTETETTSGFFRPVFHQSPETGKTAGKHFFTHSFCLEDLTVIVAPKQTAPSLFSAGRNHLTFITWPVGSEAEGFTGLVIYAHLHLSCRLKTWNWCFFIYCWLTKSVKWKLFLQAAQIRVWTDEEESGIPAWVRTSEEQTEQLPPVNIAIVTGQPADNESPLTFEFHQHLKQVTVSTSNQTSQHFLSGSSDTLVTRRLSSRQVRRTFIF